MAEFNADQALERFIPRLKSGDRVLDIGCGGNVKPMFHTPRMRAAGLKVDALDVDSPKATIRADFATYEVEPDSYDGVWASHVLEHSMNVGQFLRKCRTICKPGGAVGITVPPKSFSGDKLVDGHLTLWTPALLCYNMILAGWDLSGASVGTYRKNISVVAQRVDAKLPALAMCRGDIQKLAKFFPRPVTHGCDGWFPDTRW